MNQELTDYIKSQLAAGVTDNDTKKILVENGWAETDIDSAFRMMKQIPETINIPNSQIPVGATGNSRYDLGIPEAQEIKIVAPEEKADKEIDNKKPRDNKNLFKLIIILFVLAVLGLGLWITATYMSGWIGKKEKSLSKTVSPETLTASPSSDTVIDDGIINNISLLEQKPYLNKNGIFEIYPPKQWNIDDSGALGALVSMGNPVSDIDGENKFMANINVVSESSGDVTLEQYLAASKEVLNKTFTDYQLINERIVTLRGIKGFLIEAKYNMGVYPLHNLQLMAINKNTAYVITATSLDSNWTKYKDIFEASLLSFSLK